MEWFTTKPKKEDSPILAWGDDFSESGYLNCAILQWLNDGRNGEGWYDHSDEYGMKQEQTKWWIPLPQPPKE